MTTDESERRASRLRYPDGCLAVFAKAPIAGRVKTRLEPKLGRQAVLELHEQLIRQAWHRAMAARLAPVQLWVSEQPEHPLFRELCPLRHIHRQQGADLGERMQAAATAALQRAEFVVLVGADCPSVDSAYLETAMAQLQAGREAVLGPAEDGGYVLLGLRRSDKALFRDIPWGSDRVLACTRQRLDACGYDWAELPPRWDVDRPQDLSRLAALSDWRQLDDGRLIWRPDSEVP